MGALRKAGVWLGLVEDDDERARRRPVRRRVRRRRRLRAADAPRSLPGADRAERDRTTASDARVRRRDARRATERDRATATARPRPGPRADRRPRRARADRGRPRPTRDRAPSADRGRAERADRERGRPRGTGRARVRACRRAEPCRDRAPARPGRRRSGAPSYPTQDNLALAPQVQLRERAVVSDDDEPAVPDHHAAPDHATARRARSASTSATAYPVIMNLTEMDEPDAKRLVDFAAGLAFGLRGTHGARHQPGVPAVAAEHPGQRRGQGQDRRGRLLPDADGATMSLSAVATLRGAAQAPDARRTSEGRDAVKSIIGSRSSTWCCTSCSCYVLFVQIGAWRMVMQYGRRWRPGRGAAAALEVVWSVTDPPLKALRRVIPPLRIGTVSIDLAFLVLLRYSVRADVRSCWRR